MLKIWYVVQYECAKSMAAKKLGFYLYWRMQLNLPNCVLIIKNVFLLLPTVYILKY